MFIVKYAQTVLVIFESPGVFGEHGGKK